MRFSLVFTCRTAIFFIVVWLISACGSSEPVPTLTYTPTNTPFLASTNTPLPPTPTPIPLAVLVNGEGITLEEYEAELNRYLSAGGDQSSQEEKDVGSLVLDDLIGQTILAQGAIDNGFVLDQEALQARLDELITTAGGEESFEDWLLENGYSRQSFEKIMERSIKAAWMRDQILAEVPQSAEQVHVHQILLYNSEQAEQVLAELDSGREFATLAVINEPVTQGNLGWFPRDFLPHHAIEEAAFNLQPGEYSQVIETSVGYHIIQVVDRDHDHPLSPEARLIWQERALREWVAMQHDESEIVIFIPQEGE